MDRTRALAIVDQWVTKDFTRTHLFATEAVMRAYARRFGADEDVWGLAGLLHDADWDTFPDEHPARIVAVLREEGLTALAQAIASHGNNGPVIGNRFVPRQSQLDHALFACDEITGFVMAVALVRPTKLDGLEPKSVKKKLKDKAFAAAVSRDDIAAGPQPLGLDLDDHLRVVIAAMQGAGLAL